MVLGTELDDERQSLVVQVLVLRLLVGVKQTDMEILQQYQNVLIDLEMTLESLTLGTHHLNQFIIPLFPLTAFIVTASANLNDGIIQPVTVKPCSTYHVLNLPHVEQVFGYILLSKLFLNKHLTVSKEL